MLRKVAMGVSALALGLSGIAMTGGSASAAAPVDASGTLNCSISGTVKIAPKLVLGGDSPSGSLVLAKVKSTSCTGTSGVTSVKGNFMARLPTNDCLALTDAPFPASSFGPVKYKGAGKYTGSTMSFTSGGTFTATDPISLDIPGGGTASITSGSFAGQAPSLHFVFDQLAEAVTTSCTPKAKGVKGTGGLKKLTFSGDSYLDIG